MLTGDFRAIVVGEQDGARTNAGAEIYGGQDFNGEIRVDLANHLGGVSVGEMSFLRLC